MSQPTQQHVTRLLQAAADGDRDAADELLPLVYDDLRRYAAHLLSSEKLVGSATLQPTVLVHEAYLRLVGPAAEQGKEHAGWEGRRHFFGAAARAMRQILVDRARHIRSAQAPVARDVDPACLAAPRSAALPHDPDEFLALDSALDSLARRDGRQYEVVMLRFFAGLTIVETARALNISAATVKNEWVYARAWLLRELDVARSTGKRA